MSPLSEAQIRAMMPAAGSRLDPHLPYIVAALEQAAITTPRRIAAFFGQVGHESEDFLFMAEIADGSEYEGREDLGNVMPGDGTRYKGRGPMQVTGRANYMLCGQALHVDLVAHPELLMQPQYATASACWFWNTHELSLLADQDWYRLITRIINGGFNGLADRVARWQLIRVVLGLPPVDIDLEVGSIMEFQSRHGLVADGIAGPKTLAALRAAAACGTL